MTAWERARWVSGHFEANRVFLAIEGAFAEIAVGLNNCFCCQQEGKGRRWHLLNPGMSACIVSRVEWLPTLHSFYLLLVPGVLRGYRGYKGGLAYSPRLWLVGCW
eukprot:1160688-Pelagomonas_calceolata.AAC.10